MGYDSRLLDRPAQISQTFVSLNYSGPSRGTPICFSKNESVTECFAVLSTLYLGTWKSPLPVWCSSPVEMNAWRAGASEISPLWERDLEQSNTIYGGDVWLKPLCSVVSLEFRNMR